MVEHEVKGKEGENGEAKRRRISALVQMLFILFLVIFGTWQMFLGHFEAAFATLPLLIVYYVFVTARQRKK